MKEVVLAGVLALSQCGQATMAVLVRAQAGGLAVEWGQSRMDAAGQRGVCGLAGQRLDTNLQRNALGHIGDREHMLRRRLGELPHQLLVGSTDSVSNREGDRTQFTGWMWLWKLDVFFSTVVTCIYTDSLYV